MRRIWLAAAVLAAFLMAPVAHADHEVGHLEPPGPAVARFPAGFPALLDSEWGFPLGGFGGPLDDDAGYGVEVSPKAVRREPVIFVHGNNVDHADWYPVRDAFIAAGWHPDDLWALSYNGLGNQAGTDGTPNLRRDDEHLAAEGFDGASRITANDVNVPDLARFVDAVLDHTGADGYALVGHSLGVTLARKTLVEHPELRPGLRAFVGIAGANHGTSLCPEGTQGVLHGCSEIAAGTDWLADLNGPDGERETFGPTRWLTLYDGSGTNDAAFLGPDYADSPRLRGADNRAVADQHNDLRIAPANIERYREWLESVLAPRTETSTPTTTPAGPAPPDTAGVTGASTGPGPAPLPATGAAPALAAIGVLAVTGAGLRLLARRVS
jgi:pimeloyl-ACP methyl ester carboxylesterase